MPTSAHCRPGWTALDGVDGTNRETARLHSTMAAALLVDAADKGVTHRERGRAEAGECGDEEAALNAAGTLGAVPGLRPRRMMKPGYCSKGDRPRC